MKCAVKGCVWPVADVDPNPQKLCALHLRDLLEDGIEMKLAELSPMPPTIN